MAYTSPSSELRIFISSTFSDLQAEREHLVKKIFPEIRALCRERGVTFTEVDLRWGLTEEEGALGRIVRTCLEEVDQCRPYFIGMIGSRYGWVPDYNEIHMDPLLLAKFPWIEELAVDGVSLTEMEFIHGLFNVEQADYRNTFVYQRVGDVNGADNPERLRALIDRVHATGCSLHEFESIEDLGRHVHDDLVALVERSWPEVEAPSAIEVERRRHRAFASSRTRGYIPNPEYLNAFADWAGSGAGTLLVAGAAGLGKSSLMAFLAAAHRRRNPDVLVIEHYVGASESSGSATDVMRHIISEVRDRFLPGEEIPKTPAEIERSFSDWLLIASRGSSEAGSPALIFIDALNQLDAAGRKLTWLPPSLPAGVRLVASATPGEVAETLMRYSWPQLLVTPLLDDRVRQSIVVRYLGEFHKGISTAQLLRVISDAKAESPLYLRVVAEELRLHGSYETIDDVVTVYTGVSDLLGVFDCVLQRLEGDYGREGVRDLMSLVAASRSGLSETDLLTITGMTRMELSRLLFAFDYHLIHRDGLLGFFHDYLRQAVGNRYLGDKESREAAHRRIAEYFSTRPADERRAHEEPWAWQRAGDLYRLYRCLISPEMFEQMTERVIEYELVAYWQTLSERYDMIEAYDSMIRALDHPSEQARIDVGKRVGLFYTAANHYDAAENRLRETLQEVQHLYGENSLESMSLLNEIGTALYSQGKYSDAREAWAQVLRTREEILGPDSTELCGALDSLTAVAFYQDDIDTSLSYCRRSLELTEKAYGTDHITSVDRLANLAALLQRQGDHAGAIEVARRTVEIAERGFGLHDVRTATVMRSLAVHLERNGELQEAEEIHRRSLAIIEPILGLHIAVADSLSDLAATLARRGELVEAENYYKRARDIDLALLGEDHIRTISISLGYARAIAEQGRYDEALEMYRTMIPRKLKLLGSSNPSFLKSAAIFVRVLRDSGNYSEANAVATEFDVSDDVPR